LVENVLFTYSGIHVDTRSENLTLSDIPCSVVGGQLSCTYGFSFPEYERVNVTTQSVFTGGVLSDSYTYPTTYSPTPFITPQGIQEMYNIPVSWRGTNESSSQAIVSFEEQYWSHDDLNQFNDLMGLKRFTPNLVGFNNDSFPGGEATLDIQYVSGVGVGINTTGWSFPVGDYILDWAWAVNNDSQPPLVTSISYGDTKTGYEFKAGYGLQYIWQMEAELVVMAARGLTVIAGSGDAGWTNVGEAGNDLSNTDPDCSVMRGFYPSSSPYVTSLSAVFRRNNYLPACQTTLYNGLTPTSCSEVGSVAVGIDQGTPWTTGGGFSNITGIPSWQYDSVQYFLNTSQDLPPSSMFNASSRGYPDISAIGVNLLCVMGGVLYPIGGTSASGPVAAGLFSLLNDLRLNNNLPSLGWLNPTLYAWAEEFPGAFTDVVLGNNNDGDIQVPGSPYPSKCDYGFNSQTGWDAVTGLGTPNFQVLAKLALSEQPF